MLRHPVSAHVSSVQATRSSHRVSSSAWAHRPPVHRSSVQGTLSSQSRSNVHPVVARSMPRTRSSAVCRSDDPESVAEVEASGPTEMAFAPPQADARAPTVRINNGLQIALYMNLPPSIAPGFDAAGARFSPGLFCHANSVEIRRTRDHPRKPGMGAGACDHHASTGSGGVSRLAMGASQTAPIEHGVPQRVDERRRAPLTLPTLRDLLGKVLVAPDRESPRHVAAYVAEDLLP